MCYHCSICKHLQSSSKSRNKLLDLINHDHICTISQCRELVGQVQFFGELVKVSRLKGQNKMLRQAPQPNALARSFLLIGCPQNGLRILNLRMRCVLANNLLHQRFSLRRGMLLDSTSIVYESSQGSPEPQYKKGNQFKLGDP